MSTQLNGMSHLSSQVVLAVLAALALSCGESRAQAQYVYVTVQEGALRGSVEQTVLGSAYRRFLAIPYAEPPLGDLRFVKSRPPASWEGIRDARQDGQLCMQPDGGHEDCLHLNVFVPEAAVVAANASGDLLPVLAWIPGGAFEHGGGSLANFGPDFFMDDGVIVVTMNYRLGPLGFLSLEDDLIPGNAGLKDQLMALQWVQRNIAAFGGDPAKVTIGGESAGGCSSSHHFISPHSAGLFRAVIMQNGQAVTPWGIQHNARDIGFRLGALLGLQTNSSARLAAFLRAQDAELLIAGASQVLTDEEKLSLTHMPFGPVVEREAEDAVVTEDPTTVLKESRFNKVPILTGVTSGEGSGFVLDNGFLTDPAALQQFNDNYELATAPCLHLPTEQQRADAAWALHDFYFGEGDVTVDDAQSLVDLVTDTLFAEPTDSLVRNVSQLSDQPAYYYLFDYRGESLGNTSYGTPHASEIFFLYLVQGRTVEWDPATVEGQLRQKLVGSWSNFIKYGNPNGEDESVTWEPFSEASPNYLYITTEYELRQNKDQERMDFWHENIPL